MPAPRTRVVYKTIHPPEADMVVKVVSDALNKAALLKSRFLGIRSNLEAEWEGRQREDFSLACQKLEVQINNYLQTLEGVRKGYQSITVTIETVEVIPV